MPDGPIVGAEDEVAAQSRDRRRHRAWRSEVDFLGHHESGRLCGTSAHTHFYVGRSKITTTAGRHSQAFGHRESGCAQQSPELQLAHADCEIDTRISIHVAQLDRARQLPTGQCPLDLGDFDRSLGTLQNAVESQGYVRRIAELWFVVGAIRQCPKARTARADVDLEMERIGARPKIHTAVHDSTVEKRMTFAPHLEQTTDVEPMCLDAPPPAHRIRLLANRQASLRVDQRELEILAANARQMPCSIWGVDPEACWADEIGRPYRESQPAGIRGCNHVGMQSHSIAEVEIETFQSHERPNADADRTDSNGHSMSRGGGLDPLADRTLEPGFQHHRGQGCDQRCGDRSPEPPSSAGTKHEHRRRMTLLGNWWKGRESNPRPRHYECRALTS